MIQGLFLCAVLVTWIILDVYTNYFYIVFNNRWHVTEAAFRSVLSGYVFYLFSFVVYQNFYLIAFFWWAYFLWVYWVFFDFGLNKARRLSWVYVGNHSAMDKKIKKVGLLFNITSPYLPLMIKATVLAAIILLHIILEKKFGLLQNFI